MTNAYARPASFLALGRTLKLFIASYFFTSAVGVFAQTGIPASDGGFENATSTFAANAWIEATPGTARQWRVGTPAGSVAGGTKSAYVGSTTAFNGTAGNQPGHFYRDVVIPAGATNVQLSFYLLMPSVDNGFDYIRVFTTTTANTPVAGTAPGAGYTLRFENTATIYGSFTQIGPFNLTSLAGTTVRLVFTNISDGVAPVTPIAIDNVTLNYTPSSACSGTPTAGSVPATASTCPGGTTTITATGASAGTGISYQWQEFNGVTFVNVVGGSGATTTSYTTPAITGTKQYRMRTTCSNGGASVTTNTCTVTSALTPACYCAGVLPTANTDDNTGVRNVTFNTINNTAGAGPAYTSYTSLQTTVNAGQVYPLSVSVNTAGSFTVAAKAWIDWNQNAVFDGSEEYNLGSATNGNPLLTSGSPLNVSVPAGALGGSTIMRVRAVWDNSGTPVPCGNQDYSEAEDYTINVVACNPPTASLSVVDNCANDQFSIAVDVASYGSGTQANVVYTVNGGAPTTLTNVGLAPFNVGPFASSAVIAMSVNNGPPGCATATTQFYSGCPIDITCGTTVALDHCYQNNDPRTFLFVSDNAFETVTLTFVAGTMQATDVIRAYSGTDDTGTPIPSLTGTFASLNGVTGTSTGNELFLEIDSDGSNSCATGQQTSWSMEAECTPGCVDPDGAVTVNMNCLAYNFSIDVEVFFTGDAGTTTLRYSVNGGAPTDVPGLVASDIETIGPFAMDDIVNVRLLHESDGSCDRNLGNFTDDNSCPSAENCVNALNLGTQTSPLPGTTVGRTNDFSFACGTASTNTAPDAIYYIDVPNGYVLSIHQQTNNYDSQHYVRYGGACPGTTAIACIDDDGNEIAYVTWTNTTGTTQRVWWIQDGFGSASGTFTLQWTVSIPVPFPLATCAQTLVIPDPGCVDANFTINGQPNSLGGNVVLESVDLILTHTYRSDLSITLQTPGGQVLELITGRGGNNNNFGNNNNCPTAVFKLKDGGTALVNMPASNNTTGNWAPEQPLASLTGNPNGAWVFRICDDFTPDAGILRYLKLNFQPIDCNGVVGGPALPGTPCNDNNACTINDVRTGSAPNCGCAGTFQDTDGDGTCNASDGCPNDPNKIAPGVCGCGVADVPATYYADTDGDGFGAGVAIPGFTCNQPAGTVTNNTDQCPTDPNKQVPGACGCGVADVPTTYYADTDGDGFGDPNSPQAGFTCTTPNGFVSNNTDLCPNDINKQAPGACGCGVADVPTTYYADTDGDGFGDPNSPQAGFTCITPNGFVSNNTDLCPNDINKQSPGACGCGVPDVPTTYYADTDGDGFGDPNSPQAGLICITPNGFVSNNTDLCPNDINKQSPGVCGCGVPDVPTTYYADTDGDGFGDPNSTQAGFTCITPNGFVSDNTDLCPNDINKQAPGQCGCGVPDTDTDDDNTADCIDGCPNDPNKIAPGQCGCGIPDTDADGDATADCNDGCPNDPNKIAPGQCGCGVADTDSDGDSTADCVDSCPNDPANDVDGDGLCADIDNCPTVFGQIGNVCDADPGSGFTLGQLNASCVCQPVACATTLTIVFQTDGVSNVGWELREQGTNTLVQSGGGVYPVSPGYSINTCLPDGCYYLVVTDDAGDGFTSGGAQGGYFLMTTSGKRLVDDRNNFLSGFTSQIANNEGFCLPMGIDRVIWTSCDKLDWRAGEYIVANDNPAVTAAWPGGGLNENLTDDGYEMWFYNPNGGYSFRRYHSHATSDGFAPANATRACHIKINNWPAVNHVPDAVLLNVKVRSRVDGVNSEWGPSCRFKRDEQRAQCPLTKLMDVPGNQYLSCGATRPVGTSQASLVHARPVTRVNNNAVVNANKYQFRFRIPAEGFTLIKNSQAGQYWVNTNGLTACKTYRVDVRASFDNGATWCTDWMLPAWSDPWGDVCLLNTACTDNNGNQNIATDASTGSAPAITLYPNPNRGDQLVLSLNTVEDGVGTISVDIYDTFGKRVSTRTVAVQSPGSGSGGFVNSTIELNGELAAGMYVVNITAGGTIYTERLVIQP